MAHYLSDYLLLTHNQGSDPVNNCVLLVTRVYFFIYTEIFIYHNLDLTSVKCQRLVIIIYSVRKQNFQNNKKVFQACFIINI